MTKKINILRILIAVAAVFTMISAAYADMPDCEESDFGLTYHGVIEPEKFVFTEMDGEFHVYMKVDASVAYDRIEFFPATVGGSAATDDDCVTTDGILHCTFDDKGDKDILVVDFIRETDSGECVSAWAKGFFDPEAKEAALNHTYIDDDGDEVAAPRGVSTNFAVVEDAKDDDGDGLINEVDDSVEGELPPDDVDPFFPEEEDGSSKVNQTDPVADDAPAYADIPELDTEEMVVEEDGGASLDRSAFLSDGGACSLVIGSRLSTVPLLMFVVFLSIIWLDRFRRKNA